MPTSSPDPRRVASVEAAAEQLFVEILKALSTVDDDDREYPARLLVEIADASCNDPVDRALWVELAARGLTAGEMRRITRDAIGAVAAGELADLIV